MYYINFIQMKNLQKYWQNSPHALKVKKSERKLSLTFNKSKKILYVFNAIKGKMDEYDIKMRKWNVAQN